MTAYRDRLLAGLHSDAEASEDRTVAELKDALRILGEPVSGSKAELEERLAAAQAAAAAPVEPVEEPAETA